MNNKFYLTTAINYTNGSPHMGHAYEIICADIIARFQRLYNKNVLFSTGADNYGQKIAETAKLHNMLPIELCDKYVLEFQNLNKILGISADKYIRTTDPNHEKVVKLIWQKVLAMGDIYLGEYKGWYSITDEKFVTKTEALKSNYLDLVGKPLVKRSGASYFFKLSKYADRIIAHIRNNPNFISPVELQEEILTRLESTVLEDLSISRTKDVTEWGIPIENSEHVVYVWFDALINYLSVIDYPNNHHEWWTPDIHLIGKDICWFHTVIWTGMLMSLDLELPKTVLCHGFVNDEFGLKMSKSKGNVIDPINILNKYNPDIVRCYLAYLTDIGADLCVSEADMIEFHDHHLVAKFSNLVNRSLVLTIKLNGGAVPNGDIIELFSIEGLKSDIYKCLNTFQTKSILNIIFVHLDIVNKFISEAKPWEKGHNYLGEVRTILESVYILGHFLSPFMPGTCDMLNSFLNMEMKNIDEISWSNLTVGVPLNEFKILFRQIGDTKQEKKIKNKK
jgi:methionyl-tRNA synthetase